MHIDLKKRQLERMRVRLDYLVSKEMALWDALYDGWRLFNAQEYTASFRIIQPFLLSDWSKHLTTKPKACTVKVALDEADARYKKMKSRIDDLRSQFKHLVFDMYGPPTTDKGDAK